MIDGIRSVIIARKMLKFVMLVVMRHKSNIELIEFVSHGPMIIRDDNSRIERVGMLNITL